MDTHTLKRRRSTLRTDLNGGAIVLLGNTDASRNYVDNVYPFRQDSHFLYFVGADRHGLALVIDPDGREVLYGPPEDPGELIWTGPQTPLEEYARAGGVAECADIATLAEALRSLRERGVDLRYLPPYRGDRTVQLARLLECDIAEVERGACPELVRAVVRQRSIKSEEEISEIEAALEVTAQMYAASMAHAAPGRTEAEVLAAHIHPAVARELQQSFPPIVTVHGEVLHNTSYAHRLEAGDLMLIDSGAESGLRYASDITRTFPVSGRFTSEQRAVYEIVLDAQKEAIATAGPGVTNRTVHLAAARVIAAGLIELGLLEGDIDDVVAAGAHALFFPHGVGHMMGLDVHDMEDLGDVVGYSEGERRSSQFGLAALRLARELEPGFVITIEPGIYFIPALIDLWAGEGRLRDFIRYDRLEPYRSFGGIRIEDDVLITGEGRRVLGPGVPKEVQDVEAALGS